MFDTIKEFVDGIQNNSLLVTFLSGGVIVSVFCYIRQIFSFINSCILCFVSFTIHGRYDVSYDNFPLLMKQILFLLETKSKILWANDYELCRISDQECDFRTKAMAHGVSLRLMYGRPVLVYKYYNDSSNGSKAITYLNMRVFFINKHKFLAKLTNDLKYVKFTENDDNVNIQIFGSNTEIHKYKRNMNSIYSNNNLIDKLVKDAKLFLQSHDLYRENNIPYKRNYLFYGKPGTGKTSFTIALASEIDWNVVIINPSKVNFNSLVNTLSCSKNTIFLFEDIDAVSKNLTRDSQKSAKPVGHDYFVVDSDDQLSLSQLLNITDGLMAPSNCICVFTTNHVELLDESFLRDGRMDVKVEFEYFNWETSARMIHDKLGYDVSNIKIKDPMCPAKLQELILQVILNKKSKEEFIREISA